jgi:dienelactone hydrolase
MASAHGSRRSRHRADRCGVVVIPDVRGLHQYYKDLSDRFAEVGLDAVAIDFFARTAPKRARLAECHRQWLTSPTGEG